MIDVMERLNMGLKDFRNNTFSIKQKCQRYYWTSRKILKSNYNKGFCKSRTWNEKTYCVNGNQSHIKHCNIRRWIGKNLHMRWSLQHICRFYNIQKSNFALYVSGFLAYTCQNTSRDSAVWTVTDHIIVISTVPAVIRTTPVADFRVSFSLEYDPRESNRHEDTQLIDRYNNARRTFLQCSVIKKTMMLLSQFRKVR